ncbi:MAG: hypothetical protein PSV22_07985, partial [Pseudolabrys sp.]|nr:hypothetical protein [Pseudolabrys sp.]
RAQDTLFNLARTGPNAFVIPSAPIDPVIPKHEMRFTLRVSPVGRKQRNRVSAGIESPSWTSAAIQIDY